MLFPIM